MQYILKGCIQNVKRGKEVFSETIFLKYLKNVKIFMIYHPEHKVQHFSHSYRGQNEKSLMPNIKLSFK